MSANDRRSLHSESRPLLYHRQSRFSRQPSPERIGGYQRERSGSSNQIQTVLNSINVLVGVGMLSLPLALRYAGWAFGLLLITFSAAITHYTGKVLARCMDTDKTLKTYVDVAGASFGTGGQIVTSFLFSMNMIAACVALFILFGDTIALLVPALSISQWKIVCGLLVLPMQFVDFRVLAPISVIGVVSCFGIVVTTVIAGLIHTSSPGSLLRPAQTSFLPESPFALCASVGLFMSPWGANASFLTFYRDMKNPRTFGQCLTQAFTATYAIDIAMATCGYLMFGSSTVEEVTYNILSLSPEGYPHVLLGWLIGLTAIMPVTKITLSSRPLITMIEDVLLSTNTNEKSHIESDAVDQEGNGCSASKPLQRHMRPMCHFHRTSIRVLVIALIVSLSIMVPDFDKVISLMGSLLCYSISVVLPLMFHRKLLGKETSSSENLLNLILVVVSTMLALLGTSATLMG